MTLRGDGIASPSTSLSRRAAAVVVTVVAVVCVFAAGWVPVLKAGEQFAIDQRQRLTVPGTIADHIVIVAIDDSTFEALPMWGPASLDRRTYAPVIERIAAGGADSIALDIFFADREPPPAGTEELGEAIRQAGNVIVVADAVVTLDDSGPQVEMTFPTPQVKNAAAGIASPLLFRPDGTVRGVRIIQTAQDGRAFPALSYLAALHAGAGPLQYDLDNHPILPIRWAGESGTVKRIPFEKVHAGEVDERVFADKIVFIGRWHEMEDTLKTPVGPMNGVEVHAQATATILSKTHPRSAGNTSGLIAALVLCILLGAFAAGRPAWAVWTGGLALAAFWIVLVTILFVRFDIVMPVIGPALACVVAGPVLSALESERTQKSLAVFRPDWVRDQGEEIEATVLVCDLTGFTARSERERPAQVLGLLERFFATVDDTVSQFDGISARRPGDAAIVFFRPSPTGPHHTARAVQAALRLKERLSDVLEREGLGFGITLTTGEITLGFVGTNTPEPQVLGDPVNVAFRLQDETRARDELIIADWPTATTVEEVARMMRPLGEVQVRNRTEPVHIFAPIGDTPEA